MSEWFYHVAKLANHHLSANSLPLAGVAVSALALR
jgi:hypothetical protein